MRYYSGQRQPHQQKRSPWKGRLLVFAPPLGCSVAGAAIGGRKGADTTTATIGKKENAPEPGAGSLNGAAAGLVIGMVMAHAISWWKRR